MGLTTVLDRLQILQEAEMQLVLVVVLMMAAVLDGTGVRAHFIPRPQLRDPPNAMTLCGRQLADARMLFCYGQGYTLHKKSTLPSMNELARFEEHQEEGAEPREDFIRYWPWLERPRAKALAMEGRGKRGHGLVDECCFKPCTLDELLQYC